MKKMIMVIFAVGIMGFMGCAPGIVGKIPQVNGDFATVYIARKAGAAGCANAILIQLNDQDFIRIACGMKVSFKIPAGEKIKISQVSSTIPDDFYLEPVMGESYYFAADCNWICWFDEQSIMDYKKIERTCDKELKIEQGNGQKK